MNNNSLDTTQTQERPSTNSQKIKSLAPVKIPKTQHKTLSLPSQEVELQFRVFSYTSQEDEGKAENLSLNSDYDGNPGWHSQRFCEFPQELIIYFNSPVKLSKLVLLSHQNKISSQVDLYSYHPSFENAISANKYKRLGKFTLDNNSKSNFQARESKSVYLDTECQYLKFVLSQCHVNKYNIFNQVSIQSVKCYGTILRPSKRKSLALTVNEYKDMSPNKSFAVNGSSNNIAKFYNENTLNNRGSVLSENIKIKPMESRDNSFIGLYFDDKLISLKKEEEKALFNDDFDRLKRVRTVMKTIGKAKKKLDVLAAQKVQAISKEDYETAQMIKNEMSKIQKNIMTTTDKTGNRNGMKTLNRGRGATLSPIEYRSKPSRKENFPQDVTDVSDSYGTANSMSKPLNPISIKSMKKIDFVKDNDIFAPKRKIGIEERALPALGRQTPIDYSKVNEEEFEHQKPNQINASKLTLKVDPRHVSHVEKLTTVFGEDLAKKVCADKWYFQQEGIESAVKNLRDQLDGQPNEDKQHIIEFLADLISDFDLRAKSNLSVAGRSIKTKKNIKNLKKRVELFQSLAEQSKNISEEYLQEVCKRLPHFVDHTDLKSDYIKCLQNVYNAYGYSTVQPVISDLLISQLEQIKTIIPEAKQVLQEKYEDKERKKEQMLEEKKRIDAEPASKAFNNRRKSSTKNGNTDRKMVCEFCGKFNEKFAEEDNKDLHYLEECPKLTSCPGCEQIIEKTTLDKHLLNECEEKQDFEQCEKCEKVVNQNELDIHKAKCN
ncbi:unnamed protein product [Moneuplotes crassus]|uniref:Uncharacterized protein n=2 Tax=Euplotes crassus TaxID=5936 RepID=A0AAD2DBE5_EUPCR|nr:unnamed protein product [Moneuplotes crassus]